MCDSCINDIVSEDPMTCLSCGVMAGAMGLCGRCKPGYTRSWTVGSYHSSLGEMIKVMKTVGAREGAIVAGKMLARRLSSLPPEVRLVPLPTIAPHKRERGFDHTYLIARELARHTGLQIDTCLKRRSNTVQRGQTRSERQRQAATAYTVDNTCRADVIYLLLDDVVTTGSSMRAAARCLREAGAKKIWAASLTRQPLD